MASGFGAGASHFSDNAALIDALESDLARGVHVLVKGSRSAGLERVVEALLQAGERAGS